jgi:UDP-2,3-diacylglucosamine pyrophosphatase LpxH
MMVDRHVYVISDLHLGGTDRYGIMTRPDALAAFISGVGRPVGRRELVIAGDFVDFLAEYASVQEGETTTAAGWIEDALLAAEVLKRIAFTSRYAIVFQALAEFIRRGHYLTLMLGNHDLELSYPAVRSTLSHALGVQHGYGYRFIYDGEAYAVGDALIEHGNRYDRWNQVDYDGLGRSNPVESKIPGESPLRLLRAVGSLRESLIP